MINIKIEDLSRAVPDVVRRSRVVPSPQAHSVSAPQGRDGEVAYSNDDGDGGAMLER